MFLILEDLHKRSRLIGFCCAIVFMTIFDVFSLLGG